ncbi:hypothetical protein MKL09_09855 [Methylobacterium sp. J-048]|uniref:hypothetical protein n=1 Tax=Methylobacterium sp. J-048 TaxID=2836635 RepID=UPI001FBA8A47|nr:hypothetical protein [Methylobacterium sp. J-048]MCJ2056858.1 hypothetical protein [Methylobacterium sp. J-048]
MRAAEPSDHAIVAIEDGLASFFAEQVLDPRQFTHGIRTLSRTEVENLVEGLIDLLDGWDGEADREFEDPEASATEWTGRGTHRFNVGRAA